MASGSGKDQDPTQDPVYGPLEESNDATAAAAQAVPPPPAQPSEDLHERPGEGGGSPSPDAAAEAEAEAAAAVAATSPSSPSSPSRSAGSISRTAAPVDSVSVGEGSSFALAVDRRREATVSWKEPPVGEIVEVPKETRGIDLKNLFDTMLQEQKAIKDTERQVAQAEEQEKGQVKSPILWRQQKSSLWSKVKYGFANMGQILDREDKHQERRLLAAVTEVAGQHEVLGRASKFSNSRKVLNARRLSSSRWIVVTIIVIVFAYFLTPAEGFRMFNDVGEAVDALQTLPNLLELRNQFEAEFAELWEVEELAAPAAPQPRAPVDVGSCWLYYIAGAVCVAWLFAKLSGGQVIVGEEAPALPPSPPQVNLWITMALVLSFAIFIVLVGVCASRRL